jgi:glutamate/tyrosine decarboxylase-like PLP-dependent enzyme
MSITIETEPSPYAALLSQASCLAQSYLDGIRERFVGVSDEARIGMRRLGGELTEAGEDPHEVLRLLHEAGSPATTASMGGRFFGGVVGGSLPVAVAAHWLAGAWDQNACLFEISPVSAYLEDIVLPWIAKLFGLPPSCGGALTTGTQMADVTALAAARHVLLASCGWDVERDGLFGAPPISVVVGEEVHATMFKALSLLGFGRDRVITVPADGQGRMQASAIPTLRGPAIICAQAGNVNTGACDRLTDICDAAQENGAWVHVDGAFGLWAAVSPRHRNLVEGLDRAHSWATDAHKWLNTPHDCGIAFVRDRAALARAMAISGTYYPDTAERDPMRWGPESSRRARGVEVWAALRTLGTTGLAEQIDRTCRHATRFAQGLRAAGYAVLNDVQLNQVLVSFGSDAVTDQVIAKVQSLGVCWCGGTVWKGRRAMRISVSSWATTEEDVDRSLTSIVSAAHDEIGGPFVQIPIP